MKFSRKHLKKLARKGQGGLAEWAKKQLLNVRSQTESSQNTSATRGTKQQGGTKMAKHKFRRGGGGGGGGGIMNSAIGGGLYGAAEASMPQFAGMNPIMKMILGYLAATKTQGMTRQAGAAVVIVEAYKFGRNVNVSGLFGGANQMSGIGSQGALS